MSLLLFSLSSFGSLFGSSANAVRLTFHEVDGIQFPPFPMPVVVLFVATVTDCPAASPL